MSRTEYHLRAVEQLAEALRVAASLFTWDDQAVRACALWDASDSVGRGRGIRRSGRTTAALLKAMAECLLRGWPLVIVGTAIVDDEAAARAKELRWLIGPLVEQLHIRRSRSRPHGRHQVVCYVDHASAGDR